MLPQPKAVRQAPLTEAPRNARADQESGKFRNSRQPPKSKVAGLKTLKLPDILLKVGDLALQRLFLYGEQGWMAFGLICSIGVKSAQRLRKAVCLNLVESILLFILDHVRPPGSKATMPFWSPVSLSV